MFVVVGFRQYEDHQQAVGLQEARWRMAPYRMGIPKGDRFV